MRKARTTEGERNLNFMGPRRTCNDGMSGAGDWVIWSGAINRGNRGTTPARQHQGAPPSQLANNGQAGSPGSGGPRVIRSTALRSQAPMHGPYLYLMTRSEY